MPVYQIKLVQGKYEYTFTDLYLSIGKDGPGEPLRIARRGDALDLAQILACELVPDLPGMVMIEEITEGVK
jgi:hypothetical protein